MSKNAARLLMALMMGLCAACTNPATPAGSIGYVTKEPYTMPARFYDLQTGPTSSGLGWRLFVTNIPITPLTSTEDFYGQNAVLAKDNLRIEFRAHLIWKVNPDQIRTFVEKYSGVAADDPLMAAYANYIKEPFRTFTRDEVQKYNGLDIKDNITTIGTSVQDRVLQLVKNAPFVIIGVVIGNIQYPQSVADSVANKLAATQVLEQTGIEIQTAKAKAQIREADADGIAKAMDTINSKLTPLYVQYEAIQTQAKMANSPNHTMIYIPVGPNGVPLVGTLKQDKD
ncbi:MAG TPA: SPFH domain-containing protein [Candidatus Binataceae bacterium]|nr:SPFH domain-containing protein [Candidatus Binataceae bacterium]